MVLGQERLVWLANLVPATHTRALWTPTSTLTMHTL